LKVRVVVQPQYRTFLVVVLDEGKSVQEYADAAGVSKSVMSRHILDLGDRTRYMEAGLGLMYSRPNPDELRKHEVWLTPTGKALAKKILRLWTLAGVSGRAS
jgi:DNA-binding MarR family transcriptional regulator